MDQELARLRAIFDEVIQAPPEARGALLAKRCGGDSVLRRQVEVLIAAAESDEPFLSEPTRTNPPLDRLIELTPVSLSEGPGTRIGPYKLLQKIGEGGFGVVFMAEQDQPVRRRVALKIIKLGMDTRQVVARFEQERQALALMDHPNIARVFDAGATDSGRPYFVMEYVRGDPITAFADAHKLSVRQRLDLLAQVCTAVQHAHTKGVIHRDIKPRNVLVNMVDGKPFAKVIDFGIAKATGARLTDMTLFTEHRQLIGTPEYMSPEQAEGSPDIDTRTDVYALGVLLYELLTGATPFDAARLRSAAYAEMQRIIKEEEPLAPSVRLSRSLDTLAATAAARQAEPGKLGTLIKGELDWIVMKSLDKDRARRYETPNQLAADVQRHLSGEPVVAAPPSATYRMRKFIRKHQTGVVAASAIAAALVLGIAGTTWQGIAARRANRELVHQNDAARSAIGKTLLFMQRSEQPQGLRVGSIEIINEDEGYVAKIERTKQQDDLARLNGAQDEYEVNVFGPNNSELSGAVAIQTLERITLSQIQESVDARNSLKAANAEIAKRLDETEWNLYAANMSAAQIAITAGAWPEARERLARCPEKLRGFEWALLNEEAQSIVCEYRDASYFVPNVRSPDGSRVLVVAAKTVRLLDAHTCLPIGEPMRHEEWVGSAIFSPDNTRVLTISNGTTVRLWDAKTCQPMGELMRREGLVKSAVFSSDGTRILTTSDDATARLWDLGGQPVGDVMRHGKTVKSVAFSPDGTRVLTVSNDNVVRLWDLHGRPVGEPIRLQSEITTAIFSPDSARTLTASGDAAQIWDSQGRATGTTMRHAEMVRIAAFSPDGARVLTTAGLNAHLWDSQGRPVGTTMKHEKKVGAAVFSPDSKRVLTVSGASDSAGTCLSCSDTARLWDSEGNSIGEPMRHEWAVKSAAFSPDGSRVLTGSFNNLALLWDLHGRLAADPMRFTYSEITPLFSPDGSLVLLHTQSGTLDGNEGRSMVVVDMQHFGSNRKTLSSLSLTTAVEVDWALGGNLQEATENSVSDAQFLIARSTRLQGSPTVSAIALSPDLSRMVVAASDRTLRFYDAARREAATFRLVANATNLLFSRDGMRLILSREDGQTEIWDAGDILARNTDVEARWNQRERVKPWVEELLAGPVAAGKLEQIIARDATRTAIHKLAALDLMRERLEEIGGEAKKRFEVVRNEQLTKSRVHAAAENSSDIHPRAKQMLLDSIEEWNVDSHRYFHHLNSAALKVLCDPTSSPELVATALECAREAVELIQDKENKIDPPYAPSYAYITLGAALYRTGDFFSAHTSLTQAIEFGKDNRFAVFSGNLALLAMTNYRLGQIDEARETLEELRALMSDPIRLQHDDWYDAGREALLAEAEALIDPNAAPPAPP